MSRLYFSLLLFAMITQILKLAMVESLTFNQKYNLANSKRINSLAFMISKDGGAYRKRYLQTWVNRQRAYLKGQECYI